MIIPYDLLAIAGVCGWIFYQIAKADRRSVLLWPTYSVGLVVVGQYVLHWGYLGQAILQAALFGLMFAANLHEERTLPSD